MDIKPVLNKTTSGYKRKGKTPLTIDTPQTETDIAYLSATESVTPKKLTKTEYLAARKLLAEGLFALNMQYLGGEPHAIGSEENKSGLRQFQRFERTYQKLMAWLDFWEGQ